MAVEAQYARVFAVKVVHKRMACRKAWGVLDALVMEKECMEIGRENGVWSWARLYESWHDERNVYFVMVSLSGMILVVMSRAYGCSRECVTEI